MGRIEDKLAAEGITDPEDVHRIMQVREIFGGKIVEVLDMPRCKTCKASIIWMKTKVGKNMPVNFDDEIKTETEFDPKRMVSHYATCPDADKFRGSK